MGRVSQNSTSCIGRIQLDSLDSVFEKDRSYSVDYALIVSIGGRRQAGKRAESQE